MKTIIQEKLASLEKENDVRILFACESGSRAWGFPSTDSDYDADANDIQLSSIPKGAEPLTVLQFNKDAYSVYCKDFAAYHEWANKRNEAWYNHNRTLGTDYDSKHMMHTFRLLSMAEEIAKFKDVRVIRRIRPAGTAGPFVSRRNISQNQSEFLCREKIREHHIYRFLNCRWWS
ncbi:hypothetical protein J2T02_001557 [Chitinophaga terrae (ex Kim and Jung 2007)]|uniref:DNA polymerase beta superfamily protein n=1 Tax=Chitinophaga terrae (ex Kim and Jung 2007) TaxID=408074 RepID=UPI0027873346|nr:nucleotidyltransferase domain-containing protein [Chitinophaga terrae (ex Kim and Jung 2007)]MDQ0106449.1 hypothetical protein [Chitinophaga terrae (ex Kim and Jung 2007)]